MILGNKACVYVTGLVHRNSEILVTHKSDQNVPVPPTPANSLSTVFGSLSLVFPHVEIKLFWFRIFLAQGREGEDYSKTSTEKHPESNLTW